MTTVDVTPLLERDFRAANTLFIRALHGSTPTDEQWERARQVHEVGRVLGGFLDGELAGTSRSTNVQLAVPGGSVSAGAVTGVGVRADRTRRGVLTALMRHQLDRIRANGEPVAILHASETGIYERFGYGLATRSRRVSVDPNMGRMRSDAPTDGSVELLAPDRAEEVLPTVYQRVAGSKPGMVSRSAGWWAQAVGPPSATESVNLVHQDSSGVPDGFLRYQPEVRDHRFDEGGATLCIDDFQVANAAAAADLWRFLLGVDLVNALVAAARPVDEPLEWWLSDRREARTTRVDDDLWLRLVDVEQALRARSFVDSEPVVVSVRDAFLPYNEGVYRIGSDGVWRCSEPARASLDVSTLSAVYLGDQSVSRMYDAGRVTPHDPDALSALDRLFDIGRNPWCGTRF